MTSGSPTTWIAAFTPTVATRLQRIEKVAMSVSDSGVHSSLQSMPSDMEIKAIQGKIQSYMSACEFVWRRRQVQRSVDPEISHQEV